ncbi:50S ribosomal protein L22 [Vulcanisaeta thermophila]|uniref:50S ribosomal protein L22 n=1 Tax=Vulcanisaeta thermophila TaxID=867917 RepID=UPI000853DA9D|nr:50S ribosomal protein L22 [Vulcanisaeta thermophila]
MSRIDWSVKPEGIIKRVKETYGVEVSGDQIAKALGYEYRISWKKAVEVARFIRGFTIKQAEDYLNKVIKGELPVPIRRFTKKQAHHTTPWEGWPVAKWPVKVAKAYLEVLKNLENNATYRGLNVDNVVIVHAAVHKGRKIRNYMPRAFGRSTPWFQDTVSIELVGVELPADNVPKHLKLKPKPY